MATISIEQSKRIMAICEMSLDIEISTINDYIDSVGSSSPKIRKENILGHIGKEVMVNHVYSRITRPHTIEVPS